MSEKKNKYLGMIKEFRNTIPPYIRIPFWGILFICFLFYQHSDIWHTGGSSINMLNGHIFDFYDYNATTEFEGNSYLPTTYILFAIWNIPIRLLGIVTEGSMSPEFVVRMWYKLGTTLVFIATGVIIYKIVLDQGFSKRDSILATFLFWSSPIAVFSQFIFGQYDILTTFFMVLGIYYYFKDREWPFIACFSVAITCKYFAFLVFLPLLMYREKDVLKLILKAAATLTLFVAEVLLYIGSPAFRRGVFGFFAVGYIFRAVIDLGNVQVSIVMISWVLLCAYAYFAEEKRGLEGFKNIISLLCIDMFICFGLSFWHPQWLIMAMPFFAIATFLHKNSGIYMLLDTLLMLVFSGVVAVFELWQVDQVLFAGGVLGMFPDVVNLLGSNIEMDSLFIIKDSNLWFSMFTSVLLVMAVFSRPNYMISSAESEAGKYPVELSIRTIVGNLIFVIPSFVCLFLNLMQF